MRILFDSRDLINVAEHQRPIADEAFNEYLRTKNHEIVLSFTNSRELCSPLAVGGDFLRVRSFLQSLERMPHTHIKEVPIVAGEIRCALQGFNSGEEYVGYSPYVPRWDYTLVSFPGQLRPPTENWVNFRLDEIIYHINRVRPGVFAPPGHHLGRLQRLLENDRARLRGGGAPARQHFVGSIRKHAATHRISLPAGREDEFGEWVYANPNRCPGLRLNHEVYRALMT